MRFCRYARAFLLFLSNSRRVFLRFRRYAHTFLSLERSFMTSLLLLASGRGRYFENPVLSIKVLVVLQQKVSVSQSCLEFFECLLA